MSQETSIRRPRIAVCFFGLLRSVPLTAESIRRNILEPARSAGDVTVLVHTFSDVRDDTPISPDVLARRQEESSGLQADRIVWGNPANEDVFARFESISGFGDAWNNNFLATRNICQQHHSLKAVTELAISESPDIVIFARPDLHYHDSLAADIDRMLNLSGNQVILPGWQRWGGLNDRFAIARGQGISAYGFRGDLALDYCREKAAPMHAESVLAFALAKAGIRPIETSAKASRVRANGDIKDEIFEPDALYRTIMWLNKQLARKPFRWFFRWRIPFRMTTRKLYPDLIASASKQS